MTTGPFSPKLYWAFFRGDSMERRTDFFPLMIFSGQEPEMEQNPFSLLCTSRRCSRTTSLSKNMSVFFIGSAKIRILIYWICVWFCSCIEAEKTRFINWLEDYSFFFSSTWKSFFLRRVPRIHVSDYWEQEKTDNRMVSIQAAIKNFVCTSLSYKGHVVR